MGARQIAHVKHNRRPGSFFEGLLSRCGWLVELKAVAELDAYRRICSGCGKAFDGYAQERAGIESGSLSTY